MKILVLHNHYQQSGGEDVVVRQERDMLLGRGNDVRLLTASNDGIRGRFAQLTTAALAFYSFQWKRKVASELRGFRPDVVHVHNLFPVITPSVLYACADAGVPVVQTLHNYRLFCPSALLFREGATCEECLGKRFAWAGARHGCYRDSRAGTCVVAAVSAVHRAVGTFDSKLKRYIVLTDFSRRKLMQGGLSAARICVKPNFVDPDPHPGDGTDGYFVFVGRLSPEKGIEVLLRAWQKLRHVRLKIIGEGPLERMCRNTAAQNPAIECLGPKSPAEVYEYMGQALAIVAPSTCYENFPRTLVESFAKGTPVITSKLGSMEELVEHGRTGLHFAPGDAESLASQVDWLISNPVERDHMRAEARYEYESKYSAPRNYSALMNIYDQAITAS